MVPITRQDIEIRPDAKRVVARPFLPGEPAFVGGPSRVDLIAGRVLALSDVEAKTILEETRASFESRHRDLEAVWLQNAHWAEGLAPSLPEAEGERRMLLGAYFTQEYTPEAAAICNPSIVPFPAEGDDGTFVMSLRAIGEGHISSVEFRTGSVDASGSVALTEPGPHLTAGHRRAGEYDKQVFQKKLEAIGADPELVESAMSQLPERFTASDLDAAIEMLERVDATAAASFETRKLIHWLASSNYQLDYDSAIPISERILLPSSPAESHGIEDARFVRFTDDDGSITYYATYTAFDGFTILPQLIETPDLTTFRFATLDGACARNKGMALFPRKIDGLYAALGRHDQENLYLLQTDHIRVWNHAEVITAPTLGWEAVQIGTCGSPIETEAGWLVITHGVGPMRTYSLGAIVLDLDDPSQMIGRLERPLLEPGPDERDGYVPNVVYSCGAMVHGDWLVLPYGFADEGVRVVTLPVDALLDEMI